MKSFKFFKSSKQEVMNSVVEKSSIVEENENSGAANESSCDNDAPLKRNVYNLIILDESGSMTSIYKPALTGVNETLQTIRNAQEDNPEQSHFVTLVSFDSEHYNEIYDLFPIKNARDITEKDYRPNACTPLYDAMGKSLNKLRNQVSDEKDVVLVTIITDGYENASTEYTGQAIKALIEQLKENNWVFTYIGANQDVEAVAESMAIDNRMAFHPDAKGTREMFARERKSRRNFFGKLKESRSVHLNSDVKDDYFGM